MSSSWLKMKEALQTGRKEQRLQQGSREDCAYLSGSAELGGLCQRHSQEKLITIKEWTVLDTSVNSCRHEHRGQIYDSKEGCHRSHQTSSSSLYGLDTITTSFHLASVSLNLYRRTEIYFRSVPALLLTLTVCDPAPHLRLLFPSC